MQRARQVEAFAAGPLRFRVDLVDREGLPPDMVERLLAEAEPLQARP